MANDVKFEGMMMPPKAAAAWNMEVLGEELRDGYVCRKIRYRIAWAEK